MRGAWRAMRAEDDCPKRELEQPEEFQDDDNDYDGTDDIDN